MRNWVNRLDLPLLAPWMHSKHTARPDDEAAIRPYRFVEALLLLVA